MARQSGDDRVTAARGSRLRLRHAQGGCTPPVLELYGDFDIDTVPEIDRFLRRRLGPLYQREHLVIDLSTTTFVDSSFVAFVVRLLKELRAGRKELVLVRPGGQVRRVLALVGLPNLVPVFDTLDEALGALTVGRLPLIPPAFDAARL
jgi:anti-anti-sigma factor